MLKLRLLKQVTDELVQTDWSEMYDSVNDTLVFLPEALCNLSYKTLIRLEFTEHVTNESIIMISGFMSLLKDEECLKNVELSRILYIIVMLQELNIKCNTKKASHSDMYL